jgi:predicted membrane protein
MQDSDPGEEFRPGGPPRPGEFYPPHLRRLWRRQQRGRGPGAFAAVFLILAGTLLFLGNLGLLPIHNVFDLLPAAMIALGFTQLFRCTRPAGRFFGGLLIVFGGLFLLANFGVFHIHPRDRSWPLSMLFIALGIGMLIKILDSAERGHPAFGFRPKPPGNGPAASQPAASQVDSLHDATVFGALKRKVDTADFQGGEVNCVFGDVEIDLRRARISPTRGSVTIEANAVFGAIKIRVPDTWRVHVSGVGVLGNYEDQTIPPALGSEAPVLTVTGSAVFGSVEIKD